jgi:hypothetical protein
MINYFIWFKIDGDIDKKKKSNYSKNIHDFIFKNGIKLKNKSNAFFYKSEKNIDEINNIILKMCNNQIKLVIIKMNVYTGWLEEEEWDFLED